MSRPTWIQPWTRRFLVETGGFGFSATSCGSTSLGTDVLVILYISLYILVFEGLNSHRMLNLLLALFIFF